MGGFGSTRWGWERTRHTTDPLLFLDIRYLARHGYLEPGLRVIRWTNRGKPSGDILISVKADDPDCLTLIYRTQRPGEDWESVRDRIRLTETACHFGGARPWFLCPGCLERRGMLFSVNGRFRCRACHDLAYTSTREDALERSIRRCGVLRQQMGGKLAAPVWDIPPKPKGMHYTTYQRMRIKLMHAQDRNNDLFGLELHRIASRVDDLTKQWETD